MNDLHHNTNANSLFQVATSFLVLYVATVVVIFVPDFDHDLIRFVLISALFLISFLFQFYILNQKVKTERRRKNELSQILREQDMTARMLVRRDRDLTSINEQLREIDAMKSEFVSVAAHQLRTPLSGLKWSLDMLITEQVGKLSVEQKSLLMKSYESNERMISLVNNLLNVDRIEAGRTDLELTPLNMKDVVESVLYYILPQVHDKGIDLDLQAPSDLPNVHADGQKIREAVQNIIENAVKYTPQSGKVIIKLTASGSSVTVSVSDTGIGIPKEQQGDVFKKFFRSINAVRVKTGGTGLGLFVAREIVKKHNGTVEFESEEGKGTTFRITLPVAENERGGKNTQ